MIIKYIIIHGIMNFLKIYKELIAEDRRLAFGTEYTDESKAIIKSPGKLTSEQQSKMSQISFSSEFKSKSDYIQWYFKYLKNSGMFCEIGQVVEYIIDNNLKTLVSFGAGFGVAEYIIQQVTGCKVICTDFDTFLCDTANHFFSSDVYSVYKFDFLEDDCNAFIEQHKPDIVLFLGSACAMNNEEYTIFLKKLFNCGVSTIFNIEAGIRDRGYYKNLFLLGLVALKSTCIGRKIEYKTNVHAYWRTTKEIKKIYSDAGYKFSHLPNSEWSKNGYLLTR